MPEAISCPACHRALNGTAGTASRCEGCGAVLTPLPGDLMQEVQRSAQALYRTGVFGLVCSIGLIAFLLLRIAWLPSSGILPPRPMNGEDPARRPVPKKQEATQAPRPLPSGIIMADRVYGMCWFAVVGPCWAILVLGAARQMRQLGHYESARMGYWFAMVPLNFAWIVGLPVGIRGLRVLARPGVREAFARYQAQVRNL